MPCRRQAVGVGMRILDLSAGNRGIWFDKTHQDCVYVDIRPSVRPTVIADSRALPFSAYQFDLVVFDPPHVNGGSNSNISKDYGHHTASAIRDIIICSAHEAHRVSQPQALMAFKWNDHDRKLSPILALMASWWRPLFGQLVSVRTKHSSQTYWVMCQRVPNPDIRLRTIKSWVAA
jgi:hypothetical protein